MPREYPRAGSPTCPVPTNAANNSGFALAINTPSDGAPRVPQQDDFVFPQRRAKSVRQLDAVLHQPIDGQRRGGGRARSGRAFSSGLHRKSPTVIGNSSCRGQRLTVCTRLAVSYS